MGARARLLLLLSLLLLALGAGAGEEQVAGAEAETNATAPWLPAVAQRWATEANRTAWHEDSRQLLCRRSENRTERIGYVKTHKTGSTTLGATLFRFAARHGKRFYCQGGGAQPCKRAHILTPGKPTPPGQVFDFQLNHLSGNGVLRKPFGHVLSWYKRMLAVPQSVSEVLPPAWALVTPVREPVSHYLSWYYYFGEPDSHLSVEAWVRTKFGANVLAAEFGLASAAEVAAFTAQLVWGQNGGMGEALQLWLPMERFDDALLLLRHALRWELLDITYAVLFDSRHAGATRWDGKAIKPTPKLASLQPQLVDAIRRLNALDAALYDAALRAFEEALAQARGEDGSAEREAWDADAAAFAQLQAALLASFDAAGGACAELKRWYTLSDVEYEGEVGADGMAIAPPAARAEAMLAAYAASNGTRLC